MRLRSAFEGRRCFLRAIFVFSFFFVFLSGFPDAKISPAVILPAFAAETLSVAETSAASGEVLPLPEPDPTKIPSYVTLDAERVSYEDETGRARAEGSALLTYEDMTIQAERIDYDAATQKVKASPLPGDSVTLRNPERTVVGDGLEYDLVTGEGILYEAKSSLPLEDGTLYIFGGEAQLLPRDLAVERGLLKSGGTGDGGDYIGIWEDVAVTTCGLDHPHYRLETQRITFIPGRRLVAKKPRLYLGDTFIFAYPLDYIVQLDRRALKNTIIPYLQSSEEKGNGGGLTGSLAWETGTFTLGASYWSRAGFEWMAGIEQSLGGGFSVQGEVEHSWDQAWDEKIYHPRAALLYGRGGWNAALRWSRDEYIEERKDSLYKYRGRLDREPEFEVTTPWVKNPVSQHSHFQLGAIAGEYQEKIPGAEAADGIARYGVTLRNYTEVPLNRASTAEFFWNTRYGAWFYDKDGFDQEFAESMFGLRYRLGVLELASGYESRHVWGDSPFLWDRFYEAQRIHQKIRFPLGREIFIAVRGSYDLDESLVDEVHYALQWINDCMKWELAYHNDRTQDGDDKISLSLGLLAFPDTPATFGEYRAPDPFDPPGGVPPGPR